LSRWLNDLHDARRFRVRAQPLPCADPESAYRLLDAGHPNRRDDHGRTAFALDQPANRHHDNPGHAEVEAILRPLSQASAT
jgi:hypothetical protein